MKNRTIVFASLAACFLMLMIPSISSIEYKSIENKQNPSNLEINAPTVKIISPMAGMLYLFGSPIMSRILTSRPLCIGKVPCAVTVDGGNGSSVIGVIFSFDNGDSGFDNDGSDGFTYDYRCMHFGTLIITATAIDNGELVSSPDKMFLTVYNLGLF